MRVSIKIVWNRIFPCDVQYLPRGGLQRIVIALYLWAAAQPPPARKELPIADYLSTASELEFQDHGKI